MEESLNTPISRFSMTSGMEFGKPLPSLAGLEDKEISFFMLIQELGSSPLPLPAEYSDFQLSIIAILCQHTCGFTMRCFACAAERVSLTQEKLGHILRIYHPVELPSCQGLTIGPHQPLGILVQSPDLLHQDLSRKENTFSN
tara:strand:+ start:8980 stop:9405 length:426 start_codon:yes stop_codon:yes gene_type:complete